MEILRMGGLCMDSVNLLTQWKRHFRTCSNVRLELAGPVVYSTPPSFGEFRQLWYWGCGFVAVFPETAGPLQ